jgi:futalosine hydrolase
MSPGDDAQNPVAAPDVPADPPVALIAAVRFELEPLRARLRRLYELRIGGRECAAGLLDGRSVVLVPGGMGKVNAAQATTAVLERFAVRGLVNFGVAGAYAGAGLPVGAVALATTESYGDEGVDAPGGWLSTREIGIPLLERNDRRHFNTFPLADALVDAAAERLAAAGIAFQRGPFVTVSACSGTAARGAVLAERFGAVCESMEGAAVAHVCAMYGVPFLEVRGVSNLVEDRDLAGWKLREAAAAAAEAARVLLRAFD